MKSVKTILLIACLVLGSLASNAQIFFKNNHEESVYLSVARYINNGSSGYWMTQGWWTVIRGETKKIIDRIGPSDSLAYWCITKISETPFEGNRNLMVHNDEKFTIKFADKDSVFKLHPEFEWRRFRMVMLKPGALTGIIQFQK